MMSEVTEGVARKKGIVHFRVLTKEEAFKTSWGSQIGSVGDIAISSNGEEYPITRETFTKTYEVINDKQEGIKHTPDPLEVQDAIRRLTELQAKQIRTPVRIAEACEKIAEETPYNVAEIECIMSRLLEAMDWDTAITMYRKFGIRGLQTLRFKDHNR